MKPIQPHAVTQLLREVREGDERALDRLLPLVYDELHGLAGRYMGGERPDHTLQATALVHEAYVRLVDADVTWQDRAHFFAVAATAMRRILVDHARSKRRIKRGGGMAKITLDEGILVTDDSYHEMLALDEALTQLAEVDERKAKLIELHYFGGLSHKEAAEALGVSPATVDRDLRFARAWLQSRLDTETESPASDESVNGS